MDIQESSPIPSPDPKIKAENVQVDELDDERRKYVNSPKTTKAVWEKARLEYESQSYLSVSQLARKHGINFKTFESRVRRQGWKQKRDEVLSKVHENVQKRLIKELSAQDQYLVRLNKRSEKYEEMLDASVSQLATTPEGIPQCEPSDLDTLTRSEIRVLEMRRTALKIIPLSQVDHTTNGQGFGESFVSAIAKLRQDPNLPKLGEAELSKVLDAEIVD